MLPVQVLGRENGIFRARIWLAAVMLLTTPLFHSESMAVWQGGQSKTIGSASAGIPKVELDREAALKVPIEQGRASYKEGRYQEAVAHFREALEQTKSLDPKLAGNVLIFTTDDALTWMGKCYLKLDQMENAQNTFASQLEWRKKYLPNDSSVAITLETLATLDIYQNNDAKAEDHLKQAITYIDEAIDHFKSSETYAPRDIVANDDRRLKSRLDLDLAELYTKQNRYDDALSACEKAFQIGDEFRADPRRQSEIVSTAIFVAQRANRPDELRLWEERNNVLKTKKD